MNLFELRSIIDRYLRSSSCTDMRVSAKYMDELLQFADNLAERILLEGNDDGGEL